MFVSWVRPRAAAACGKRRANRAIGWPARPAIGSKRLEIRLVHTPRPLGPTPPLDAAARPCAPTQTGAAASTGCRTEVRTAGANGHAKRLCIDGDVGSVAPLTISAKATRGTPRKSDCEDANAQQSHEAGTSTPVHGGHAARGARVGEHDHLPVRFGQGRPEAAHGRGVACPHRGLSRPSRPPVDFCSPLAGPAREAPPGMRRHRKYRRRPAHTAHHF